MGYDLNLAKWLLVSMAQKNLLKTSYSTDEKKGAQELNKMVMDTLVAVSNHSPYPNVFLHNN